MPAHLSLIAAISHPSYYMKHSKKLSITQELFLILPEGGRIEDESMIGVQV